MIKAVSIDDLRRRASKRIPRMIFDFLDGGAGNESGLRRNREALDDLRFIPRALVDVDTIDTQCRFLGRQWAMPFGVAPIGMSGMVWPGAEIAMARAAAFANIPYTLSTAGTTSLERLKEASPDNAWFQLYYARDPAVADDLVARADNAGYDVLMVTVDVPRPARRLRDITNNFGLPFRPSLRLALDVASRPQWSLATLRNGMPRLETIAPYAPKGSGAQSLAAHMSSQSTGRLDWEHLKRLRDRWPRHLIAKGIMSPEDAERAKAIGLDAIAISNHGGRQLEGCIATIEALPAIRAATGPDYPIVFDGGVRSGEHIAKALAAGASFVLAGRAFLYGIAAHGPENANVTIDLLQEELMATMAQLGAPTLADIRPEHLFKNASAL
ncbi:alpha-hydroxy-acid oxidizing protein [Aureimonas fodinaquatilis]|uniref:Alpha-hydroxy-acid oxidizing protein n=1 Tax=Aureimonas fodinaquatilis TaxID=2565783 RepID=A0A5B0DV21_9HYPH|nr:alpha-hydroxy acid oxidase [Aureimonas fodinaquatilis]KAA0969641.1 alpha-hydroxy-acid oxidizing protein [Aureimonas fodinaquatilis]